jgi:hypothetical protein
VIVKIAAAVVLTALATVLGEVIIRRNRRSRVLREHLTSHGSPVTGQVRTVDKVSTGKYGTHKIRAVIEYQVDGVSHTHAAVWMPQDAPQLVGGESIDLLVDVAQPSSACVAGAVAPPSERDAPYRWFAVGVGVASLILVLVS